MMSNVSDVEAGVPLTVSSGNDHGNEDPEVKVVVSEREEMQIEQTGPPPEDYFMLSLLTVLFCYWPLGLLALLRSAEAKRYKSSGKWEEARGVAADALRFGKLSIIIGVISQIITWSIILILVILALSISLSLTVGRR